MELPETLTYQVDGNVGIIELNRPAKRNALDAAMVAGLHAFFSAPPAGLRAAVICGAGEAFSAGLDLGQVVDWDAEAGMFASLQWYRAFDAIESGLLPVVSALHGAVIGGGFELAAATHVRVAERTAFFALPEATRGIFLGGGGAVRIPRLIGTARVTDMMLTGRVYDGASAVAIGAAQYLVEEGRARATALELARKIAGNAPLSNALVLQALPRIAEASPHSGYITEAAVAAVASSSADAKQRVRDFLEKRAAKVERA